MKGARICVVAGMIDAKLAAKIAPLQANGDIAEIHLVRRQPFEGEKIVCHTPPAWALRSLALAEAWRFAALILLCLSRRPRALVAFGTVPHGIYCWLAGKLLRVPVVQHVMGKNDLRLTFPVQRGRGITLAAVKAAELVAVRGERMACWLNTQGVARERIFIPQNVHDFSHFAPASPLAADHDLVYLGLLAPYKRVDLMLEALAAVVRRRPTTRLLLVGDGPERQRLQRLAETLGVSDRVTFAGRVDYAQTPEWLARGRIFLMTSQGEGLPQAMIEAMSCGLPAVIAADADVEEVAREGENALLVREQAAEAYARVLLRLLEDDELFATLRAGALAIRGDHAERYSAEYQRDLWQGELRRLGGWPTE